ncbi:MAG: prepilin-type N-terminal cleavage/methylation domain-containing protein [Endomicrobiales bacterium]|nr:prepilin-type N-terminal cleavage/methylation domain-containing protein [Endomicrobiales bacterium]
MKKSKGFTLIELMIVVAIIGILSAIAIPKFADLIRKSNEGATKGNLGAIRSAISIYYGEMEGWFPSPAEDGSAPQLGALLTMENGKYLKEMANCYCPPYHAKTTSVEVTVSSGNESAGAGAWGYRNDPSASTDKQWGDLWVNCTHTDSKGTAWSIY